MTKDSYIELGGTLFIPASHKDLDAIINGNKYPELKSLVIDFEDGLDENLLYESMLNLKLILKNISSNAPIIFLRARSVEHLKALFLLEEINNIQGFVLAKFSLKNAREYMSILKDKKSLIMPSIEGEELFNQNRLYELLEIISANKERITLVRFGLEDMLRQLGMRRKCDESIFDFSATNSVLGNFIATFKSAGFSISGGVYPCYKDEIGFINDVKRDLKEGLFSKTIIHPNQIKIINELYKVSSIEFEEAKEICSSKSVVFSQNGKMAEVKTMHRHSLEVIRRAEVYGINAL